MIEKTCYAKKGKKTLSNDKKKTKTKFETSEEIVKVNNIIYVFSVSFFTFLFPFHWNIIKYINCIEINLKILREYFHSFLEPKLILLTTIRLCIHISQ